MNSTSFIIRRVAVFVLCVSTFPHLVLAQSFYVIGNGLFRFDAASQTKELLFPWRGPHTELSDVVVGQDYLYWSEMYTSDDTWVFRSNATTEPEIFVTVGPGFGAARSLAIDFDRRKLLLAGHDLILCTSLEGGKTDTLVTGAGHWVFGIVIDHVADQLYWLDSSLSPFETRILRADIAGQHVEEFRTGLVWATDLEIDPIGRRLYWIDGNSGKIQRSDLSDAGTIETVVETGVSGLSGIALNVAGNEIFWTNGDSGEIWQANFADVHQHHLIGVVNGARRITFTEHPVSITSQQWGTMKQLYRK